MRICLVIHDLQEFGGLEEYATSLAVALKEAGHEVSVLSDAWAPAGNQYVRRLQSGGVDYVQLPKWLSLPASEWATKERMLRMAVAAAAPLVHLAGLGLLIVRRGSWRQSVTSARNRLQAILMTHVIGPDRRQPLARMLLRWWRFWWRPDLLHLQGYATGLLYVIDWAAAHHLPVAYEEHQTPDPQFDWWQGFQSTINKATVVIAVSHESARGLRSVCGVTRPIVVRQSVLPDPMATGWRRDERPSGEPLRVTTVARLYVTKGLPYLLETIALVKRSHPATEFRVYGDGPLRDELLAHAARLGLDGPALFPGPFTSRDDLTRIMADTDVFLLSSVLEGQPLAIVEAMAYGCAILATTVGGIPELIHDGANGLLCPPKDPLCLAGKLTALLDDPDLRARLGRAARHSYERSPFQPAAVGREFITVYQDMLRDAQGSPAA
jgi:glycosyltransferase involved in cell wall biosynthesis